MLQVSHCNDTADIKGVFIMPPKDESASWVEKRRWAPDASCAQNPQASRSLYRDEATRVSKVVDDDGASKNRERESERTRVRERVRDVHISSHDRCKQIATAGRTLQRTRGVRHTRSLGQFIRFRLCSYLSPSLFLSFNNPLAACRVMTNFRFAN